MLFQQTHLAQIGLIWLKLLANRMNIPQAVLLVAECCSVFHLCSGVGWAHLWKSVQSWRMNPCEACRVWFATYCYVVFCSCSLPASFLTENTAVDLAGWRPANWHFTGVAQEWRSRDESSCLDFRSSSLIPGPLCLWAAQESDLLSSNTIVHEDCISNSLFPPCNKPWYPDKMLLLGPQ